MSATKQFRTDDNNQVRAFASGNRADFQKAKDILMNRQYSRSTYMGLNTGG